MTTDLKAELETYFARHMAPEKYSQFRAGTTFHGEEYTCVDYASTSVVSTTRLSIHTMPQDSPAEKLHFVYHIPTSLHTQGQFSEDIHSLTEDIFLDVQKIYELLCSEPDTRYAKLNNVILERNFSYQGNSVRRGLYFSPTLIRNLEGWYLHDPNSQLIVPAALITMAAAFLRAQNIRASNVPSTPSLKNCEKCHTENLTSFRKGPDGIILCAECFISKKCADCEEPNMTDIYTSQRDQREICGECFAKMNKKGRAREKGFRLNGSVYSDPKIAEKTRLRARRIQNSVIYAEGLRDDSDIQVKTKAHAARIMREAKCRYVSEALRKVSFKPGQPKTSGRRVGVPPTLSAPYSYNIVPVYGVAAQSTQMYTRMVSASLTRREDGVSHE